MSLLLKYDDSGQKVAQLWLVCILMGAVVVRMLSKYTKYNLF